MVELIADEASIEANQVVLNQELVADLDLDCLSIMTIVTLAEDRFSVQIPDEVVPAWKTVGDVAAYVTSRLGATT
ncbi:MAG: acyl carrier protein [Micrococcales bacterium]|nr:acyl carrier protein [Micrococcales bacterium]